jgi:hypothetical protein
MEYVMVPVPEEFVAEVTQYLQWNTGTPPPDFWPDDAIARFVEGLDESARAVLLHAARGSDGVVVMPVTDVAEATGCTPREVVGLVVELNEAARNAGGPPFIMATTLLHGEAAGGPEAWSVNMPGAVAKLVLDATGGRREGA